MIYDIFYLYNKKWNWKDLLIFHKLVSTFIKNVSSSTSHKKRTSEMWFVAYDYGEFSLAHSFMDWFWSNFLWMPTLWRKSSFLIIKVTLFFFWGQTSIYKNLALWNLTLWRCKYFLESSLTSKVIKGHIRSLLCYKITLS